MNELFLSALSIVLTYCSQSLSLQSICSSKYMAGKSYCEDLTEGKFSFPIIHAVHAKPDDNRLLNILRQKSDEFSVKQHAVKWMHHCGSFEYTRSTLRDLKGKLFVEIETLGGHPGLVALVESLDSKMDKEDSILGSGDAPTSAEII